MAGTTASRLPIYLNIRRAKMLNFIVGLPTVVWVLVFFVILLSLAVAGYMIGVEVGLDRGHRIGFDLGRRQISREVTSQIDTWASEIRGISEAIKTLR
jgi:hypothetical protein